MKSGDRIWHTVFLREGTCASTPRDSSMKVRVKLDGNQSSSYYLRTDITLLGEQGPVAPAMQPPIPDANEPTLKSLTVLRNRLRDDLDRLDEQLMFCRFQEAFGNLAERMSKPITEATIALGRAVQSPQAAPPRRVVKEDAEKIKADTARALQAANRLFARGAL